MAKEALDRIREAEKTAREIISEASQKARDIRRDAEVLAEKEYKGVIAKAQHEAELQRDKARQEGESLAQPILESGSIKSAELESMEVTDLMGAVDIIIERIVKANGNR